MLRSGYIARVDAHPKYGCFRTDGATHQKDMERFIISVMRFMGRAGVGKGDRLWGVYGSYWVVVVGGCWHY